MRRILLALLMLPLLATPASAATDFNLIPGNTSMYTAADVDTLLAAKVATTRSVNTTGPILGGGSLAADLTISLQTAGVANSHLGNMATATFKGRTTAGTGVPEDLTVTQATALLNVFGADTGAGGVKGLTPATAAGDATKFLRGDATWQTVTGGGTTPTGTGFRHVTAGTEDAAAALVVNADVSGSAAIAFSKLSGVAASTHASTHQVGGADALTILTRPAAITADQNDYAPVTLTGKDIVYITSSAGNRTITGLAGGADGQMVEFVNVHATARFVFSAEDVLSAAANRFDIPTSVTIWSGGTLPLVYDGTNSRWRSPAAPSDSATAGQASLRTLGTSATSAAAGNDARLSDARAPTAHATSHKHGGADEVATATAAANSIPKTGAGVTLDIGWIPLGTTVTTVTVGNDARLSDARAPTAHTTSHQSGGSDSIPLDTLAAPTDITTLNATTGLHGLLPKLGGGTTNFLRADGTWASPSGSTPGSLIGTSFLVAGTTFTTNSASLTAEVELLGGGGGGGGTSSAAGQAAAGGGGASGAWAVKRFTVAGSTGYTIAIGAAGAAGTSSAGIGGAGGDTTFTVGGTTVTAKGGGGGNAMATGTTVFYANGGAGSLSTSGDLNGSGAPATYGIRNTGLIAASGMGGSSFWGGGGVALVTGGTGNAGQGRGGGGGGGLVLNGSAAVAGGAGTAGAIIVREYR